MAILIIYRTHGIKLLKSIEGMDHNYETFLVDQLWFHACICGMKGMSSCSHIDSKVRYICSLVSVQVTLFDRS